MQHIEDVSSHLATHARNAPYLEREEEHQLALRWKEQRDDSALHTLAQAHMRLVISMAYRFRNYGLPTAELVQEGHIGLLEAAARFDPDREVRFSTYATWWIRASIQDFILRNWSIVRGGTSSAQKALFFNLRRLRAKLSRQYPEQGNVQTFADIAMALGVSPGDVETMHTRITGQDLSLNAPVNAGKDNDGAERGDFLVDPAPGPDIIASTQIDNERRSVWLQDAMRCLNPRELRVLQARRLEEESLTLDTLGAELGISKERVRQIENRAMEKLRAIMLSRHGQAMTPA